MERLIIIEEGMERMFNITTRVVSIGRSSKNDIGIKDKNASRKHCNVLKVGDSWFVVDCESQNGTYVNGEKIKKKELCDGDKINIGSTEILFLIAKDNEEFSMHKGNTDQLKANPNPLPEEFDYDSKLELNKLEKLEDIGAEEEDSFLQELADKKNPEVDKISNLEKEEKEEKESAREDGLILPEKKFEEHNLLGHVTQAMPKMSYRSRTGEIFAQPKEQPEQKEQTSANKMEEEILSKDFASIQEGYDQFLIRMKEQEEMARLFFFSVMSGANCLISSVPNEDAFYQYVVLERMASMLSLSLQSASDKYSLCKSGQISHTTADNIKAVDGKYTIFFANCLEKDSSFRNVEEKSWITITPIAPMSLVSTPCIPLDMQPSYAFYLPFSKPELSLEREMAMLCTYFVPREEPIIKIVEMQAWRNKIADIKTTTEAISVAAEIVRFTRPEIGEKNGVKEKISKGLDTYGGIVLLKIAKVWAAIQEKDSVSPDDVRHVAQDVVAPRLCLTSATYSDTKSMYDDVKSISEALLKSMTAHDKVTTAAPELQ